jgi:mRNA interferase RelE/StbE
MPANNTRRYRVEIERDAAKALRRLPKNLLGRIRAAIWDLADDPRPPGYIKLAGFEDLYRIRVGDWRIIYTIEDERLLVLVVEIGPRGSVYRVLS